MPTFDVVSEIDSQEVKNAVDQTAREIGTRFDFKNTNSTIDLGDEEITIESNTEDRLDALRQVLEEKLVKLAIRAIGRSPDRMPWFEVYATTAVPGQT